MPILGVVASSYRSGVIDTGAMFPLQVITVGPSGVSEVNFTNIPSTYTHLQLRYIAQSTQAGTGSGGLVAELKFNSATLTKSHYLYANGSTVVSGADSIPGFLINLPRSGNTNVFAACVVDILDYKDTNKNKTVRWLGGYDANGLGELALVSNLWANTSAITSINITPSANNFSANSQFALYGIKGA